MNPQNPWNQSQPPSAPPPAPSGGYPPAPGVQGAPNTPSAPPTPPSGYAPQPTPAAWGAPASPPQPGQVAGQYPVDYLNQIAAPTQVKKMRPAVLFGLIGGVVSVAILAVVILAQITAPPDVSKQLFALQARLTTLTKVAAEQNKHIAQNDLSNINSTLQTQLKTTSAGVTDYMTSKGLTSKDKRATAANTTEQATYTALSKKLNNAYLTGTLDQTYANEMSYQLAILKSMLQRLKTTANSKKFTEVYNTNITSLDTLVQQLNTFKGTQ